MNHSSPVRIEQAEAFLKSKFDGVEQMETLQGGHWSQAFGFRTGSEPFVARFGEFVEDFEKDALASKLRCEALPAPEVLEVGSSHLGYHCISRRAFGTVLEEATAEQWQQVTPAVLDAMDVMREPPPDFWPLATIPWAEQLIRVDDETSRLYGWHDWIAARGSSVYDRALRFFKERVSELPDTGSLLHNDLLHANVLFEGNKITGLFDWGNAVLGDFVYELAMFTFYKPWYPALASIDWEARLKDRLVDPSPGLALRLQCYEIHLGLAGMAYSAFQKNVKDFDGHSRRTLEILDK